MKKAWILLTLAVFLLAGCYGSPEPPTPTLIPTAIPVPTAQLPTPLPFGSSIVNQEITVLVDKLEVSGPYTTDFNTRRDPPVGKKIAWVHIQIINPGESTLKTPGAEHFSILYGGNEIKSTYGHRQDYPEFTDLSANLFPGQALTGWLRFDIPTEATLENITLSFYPNNKHLPALTNGDASVWADQPIYIWVLH